VPVYPEWARTLLAQVMKKWVVARVGGVLLVHWPLAVGPEVTSANSMPDAAKAELPVCG
jgi:hypothetical protein